MKDRAMNSSDKLCLKLNNHLENFKITLDEQRDNPEFRDVTLACEDKQIEAHKIILSASSFFLNRIIKKNKHPHPYIYMKGMKAKDLVHLVNFIYNGEVNIYQEDLDDFLTLAQEMEIKGMKEVATGSKDNNVEKQLHYVKQPTYPVDMKVDMDTFNDYDSIDRSVSVTGEMEGENVSQQLESMMMKIDGIWTCTVCGYITKRNVKSHLREHVETHLEGVTHPCNICGKIFRLV